MKDKEKILELISEMIVSTNIIDALTKIEAITERTEIVIIDRIYKEYLYGRDIILQILDIDSTYELAVEELPKYNSIIEEFKK